MRITITGRNIELTEGLKGSGRGEAFQTGEVFRTGYQCICYIKRGEGAPED